VRSEDAPDDAGLVRSEERSTFGANATRVATPPDPVIRAQTLGQRPRSGEVPAPTKGKRARSVHIGLTREVPGPGAVEHGSDLGDEVGGEAAGRGRTTETYDELPWRSVEDYNDNPFADHWAEKHL
jgi:hypothetical protein